VSELRRVGLNLLFLVPDNTGGTGVYARNLITKLALTRPDLELVAIVNREAADLELDGAEVVRTDVRGRPKDRRVPAEKRLLPELIREHGIDLLHCLNSWAPLRLPAVRVVTVHDVIFGRFPRSNATTKRMDWWAAAMSAARDADRVITPSEASAADVTRMFGVPRSRVDVVSNAGKPPGPATAERELRRRLALGDAPIVLCVSPRRDHKNTLRLFGAFARLRSDPAPVLVNPGYPTRFEAEIDGEALRLGIADRVRLPGWVSDEDLEGLYGMATCLVVPSLIEGFGMPVLEAMERGLPVTCSNAASLPEVAGDAARYFDPREEGEIARAVAELIRDSRLRERLAAAGRERARRFSWERTARQTIESYERAWFRRKRPGSSSDTSRPTCTGPSAVPGPHRWPHPERI
jgi:glycosyltransferase involved in cell wall biosynthesis